MTVLDLHLDDADGGTRKFVAPPARPALICCGSPVSVSRSPGSRLPTPQSDSNASRPRASIDSTTERHRTQITVLSRHDHRRGTIRPDPPLAPKLQPRTLTRRTALSRFGAQPTPDPPLCSARTARRGTRTNTFGYTLPAFCSRPAFIPSFLSSSTAMTRTRVDDIKGVVFAFPRNRSRNAAIPPEPAFLVAAFLL